MRKKYTHYINVKLVKAADGTTHCFDDVVTAGDWLVTTGEAATANAARTGVYCALEGRIEHYRYYLVTADHIYPEA